MMKHAVFPSEPAELSETRPLRIAFVLSSLGAGGAERVVALIASSLAEQGHAVTLISFDSPDDPVYHPLDSRILLQRLGMPSGARGLGALFVAFRRLSRLRRALKLGRFAVAVSFLTKINALSLIAARGLDLPVVVSERNNPRMQPVHAVWQVLLARFYRHASAIAIQTDRARACLPDSQRERAVVVPNPMPPPDVEPKGRDRRNLVGVGRLVDQKGFDLLIEAFAQVADEFPDWKLVIWGDGARRGDLEERIASYGLKGRALLPGTSARAGSWAEEATVLALTSRYEGCPNVIGEAMALGIPVVAADCDFGPAQLIDDGEDGLLVPCEDVPALASALRRILGDELLRERLGHAALARASREGAEQSLAAWRDLIVGSARTIA